MRLIFMCLLLKFLSVDISSGYDDISALKPTKQQGNQITDVSQNAVDGSISNCSSTDPSDPFNPAWWYVDLEKVKSVYDVEIYFKLYDISYEQRQRERMYGYTLYISNSTDFSLLQEAYLCYNHTGPDLPDLNVTHICVSFGRYVIFYNERVPGVWYPGNQQFTYTQLCEVIVQGCKRDDAYGYLCNETCPTNCQERRCYITNGTCAGCTDGWTGQKCLDASGGEKTSLCYKTIDVWNLVDICPAGHYGAECKGKCPNRCRNNSCNHVTGHCEGCQTGWMGYDCNETCSYGTYGENCGQNCSGNCAKQKDCSKDSGYCQDGCAPGYQGTKCEKQCDFGTYGANCVKLCSGNCLDNKICNNVHGECMNGCKIGFKGILCNETCEHGTFGLNCSDECSKHCVNKSCNYVTGSCNNGCMPGWRNDKCNKKCSNGTFGNMCEEECSGNCLSNETCYHVDGHCLHGCQSGFQGEKCDAPCGYGTFGVNCSDECSNQCVNKSCNHITGFCDNGCLPGWRNDRCNKKCSNGTFGIMCKNKCSGNCLSNETCYHVNGHCMKGCKSGFQGEKCDAPCDLGHFGKNCSQICSVNCYDKCDNINGQCKCKRGWMGRNCSEVCSSGYYGVNCEERCSVNCLRNESCNVKNGSCPSGCQEDYEGDTCQRLKGPALNTSEKNKENVIYGVVSGVVLVIVLVVVIFIWRRRTSPASKGTDGSQQSFEFVLHSTKEDKLTNDGEDFHSYKNEMLQNNSLNAKQGRIHLKDLCTTIKILSDQENTGFKEEYKEIPNGELHPCEVGKREENKVKNRYTTTFPYDHTRVTLQESNKNDGYINANYIRDLSGEKRYIATQGPKKKTIAEFWEMVWQETVTTIVCLTNLKEGTREKCRQYWPNNSAKIQHGHFAIRNNEEKNYANYVTRNFHVQNIDVSHQRKEERDVRMFHYTQWTDHGVPEALNLVMFHRHFLRSLSGNSLQHKIVVHCSAGIGRTGTFIALDALYRDGLSSGSVNVKEFVTQMRHDRMNMIQGEDQYKMVYAALYESFRGDLHPVDAETFLSQYQNSSCYVNLGEVANKKSPVEDQFKELKSLNPYHTVNNSVSGHANFGANFTEEDLPNQKYKCYVLSDDDKEVHYNNAVILQSFTKPDGIISAQYPNENQCEDFLYLVRKSGAGTVVFLGQLSDVSSSKCWFPSKNDTKVVGDFTVKMRICTPSDCVTKTNIIIQKKGFKDVAVSVLECNFWREDTVVADCRKVLNVITETRLIESTRPDSRTLVLSSDGAKRCGPFCVAYNAIEQLILDKEVDIFTTTRLIQIRRPDMISTIEEYQFCHDLIAEYLQNDTVYANYSN